jgi:uroporphyrinogen-III decarboxylase
MDPDTLKSQFGDQIVFWGGGIDTQHTLPFGTPEEIRAQVEERMGIFAKGGGFVFNAIHNIQAGIPKGNLIALFEAIPEYRN